MQSLTCVILSLWSLHPSLLCSYKLYLPSLWAVYFGGIKPYRFPFTSIKVCLTKHRLFKPIWPLGIPQHHLGCSQTVSVGLPTNMTSFIQALDEYEEWGKACPHTRCCFPEGSPSLNAVVQPVTHLLGSIHLTFLRSWETFPKQCLKSICIITPMCLYYRRLLFLTEKEFKLVWQDYLVSMENWVF